MPMEREGMLSRWEGWRQFAEAPAPPSPERLTATQLNALGPGARDEYDQARRRHHAMILIRTPQVQRVHETLWDLTDSSQQGPDRVKGAAVIDAPPALGKSTCVNAFGKEFHAQQTRRHGATFDSSGELIAHIPVCRIGFTGAMTVRALHEAILTFYAHPSANRRSPRSYRNRDLAVLAADRVTEHGTRLLILDDVHFLKMRSKDGIAVANELKALANEYPATFLFTGVGMRSSGLLDEGYGPTQTALAQIGRRWTVLTMEAFTQPDDTWRSLIATLEAKLVLADSGRGMLQQLAEYLFQRSTGTIGSLIELVIRGAARAIRTGTETITMDLLDQIPIDASAEQNRDRTRRQVERSRRRSGTRQSSKNAA